MKKNLYSLVQNPLSPQTYPHPYKGTSPNGEKLDSSSKEVYNENQTFNDIETLKQQMEKLMDLKDRIRFVSKEIRYLLKVKSEQK